MIFLFIFYAEAASTSQAEEGSNTNSPDQLADVRQTAWLQVCNINIVIIIIATIIIFVICLVLDI